MVLEDLHHPQRIVEQFRERRAALAAMGWVLTLPDDNPRALRGSLSGRRAVAWAGGMPFDDVRHFARHREVKINDVLLSALAGAFGAYLRRDHGQVAPDQNLRVSIPVNLRPDDDDGSQGNRFGLVLLDLPVGVENCTERLQLTAQRMRALKESSEARVMLANLGAAGRMPVAIEKGLIEYLSRKAVAVVSNLPGPKRPLSIGGAQLRNLVFWPPQAGGIGIGVSVFSYTGAFTMGISTDTGSIVDPKRIVDAFGRELKKMLRGPPRVSRASSRGKGATRR